MFSLHSKDLIYFTTSQRSGIVHLVCISQLKEHLLYCAQIKMESSSMMWNHPPFPGCGKMHQALRMQPVPGNICRLDSALGSFLIVLVLGFLYGNHLFIFFLLIQLINAVYSLIIS